MTEQQPDFDEQDGPGDVLEPDEPGDYPTDVREDEVKPEDI